MGVLYIRKGGTFEAVMPGSAGAVGATGPAGATGATGATGPAGSGSKVTRYDTSAMALNTTVAADPMGGFTATGRLFIAEYQVTPTTLGNVYLKLSLSSPAATVISYCIGPGVATSSGGNIAESGVSTTTQLQVNQILGNSVQYRPGIARFVIDMGVSGTYTFTFLVGASTALTKAWSSGTMEVTA